MPTVASNKFVPSAEVGNSNLKPGWSVLNERPFVNNLALPFIIERTLLDIGVAVGEISTLSSVTSITDTAPAEGFTLIGKTLAILVEENLGTFVELSFVRLGIALVAVTDLSTNSCSPSLYLNP